MRRVWLIQEGRNRLILFFGGWGLDERSVSHLTGDSDVLMFYDYRYLLTEEAPDTTGYDIVDVAAWSMGVWAAATLLARWKLPYRRAVAINGTERPVDDQHGIPPAIYSITERGMNYRGWERFIARSTDGKEERDAFRAKCRPYRGLEEQVEELRRIREQAATERHTIAWNRAFISEEDVIFPVENQRNWWKNRSEIAYLAGGHYPFFRLSCWDSIIDHDR
jgi:biotin synthesis protein BioG